MEQVSREFRSAASFVYSNVAGTPLHIHDSAEKWHFVAAAALFGLYFCF